MTLNKELLEILACPKCKGRLEYGDSFLTCKSCSLRYPVREGIPVLLVDEAEKIPADE